MQAMRVGVLLCLLAVGCSKPQQSTTAAAPVEREPDAAPTAPPASDEDVQNVKELADEICACVRDDDDALACVQAISRGDGRTLQRSDERVARHIERAQTCARLAKVDHDQDQRSAIAKFLEALFR
jgi:hypothetical protein